MGTVHSTHNALYERMLRRGFALLRYHKLPLPRLFLILDHNLGTCRECQPEPVKGSCLLHWFERNLGFSPIPRLVSSYISHDTEADLEETNDPRVDSAFDDAWE